MVAQELVKRSPLRIFESSTEGGLRPGDFGVLAGPKGVGKTACLVHIATDVLLQGRPVIHVSFSEDTSHIDAWYDDIFRELARRYGLDGAMEVHDSIIRNRVIANFVGDDVEWSAIETTIRALMQDAAFSADTVVVDGYGFPPADTEAFRGFKRFAADMGLKVWLSATSDANPPLSDSAASAVLPAPMFEECGVVIVLVDHGSYIHLELVKDHGKPVRDVHLKLDPHILLIAEEA